jgi:hypothetical protein
MEPAAPTGGAERHTQPVSGGIAWVDSASHPAQGPAGVVPTEELSMRHALITTHLLRQARDAAIARAEADERLDHHAGMLPRAQPAEPGRFARVVTLARRVGALAARTT